MKIIDTLSNWNLLRASGLAILACLLLGANPVGAQIIADFSGGNSSTVVDAYSGTAGGGWTSAWVIKKNLSTTVTPSVLASGDPGFVPLSGTTNYLQVDVTNQSATLARTGDVSRTYGSFGSLDITTIHTVSFLYRYDQVIGDLQVLSLFDGNAAAEGIPQTSSTSWLANGQGTSANGVQWVFSDGGTIDSGGLISISSPNRVESNVRLVSGDRYSFEMLVDPANNRFQVDLTNLDYNVSNGGVASFQSNWISFLQSNGSVFGNLNFAGRVLKDVDRSIGFSVDQIALVPEPSTGILFGLGLATILGLRRRR